MSAARHVLWKSWSSLRLKPLRGLFILSMGVRGRIWLSAKCTTICTLCREIRTEDSGDKQSGSFSITGLNVKDKKLPGTGRINADCSEKVYQG